MATAEKIVTPAGAVGRIRFSWASGQLRGYAVVITRSTDQSAYEVGQHVTFYLPREKEAAK